MNLVLDIAWTHIRARGRQTFVAVAGVAVGVGFSIMMAALMVGSQEDFMRQLIDALPHISVTDERRAPPPQPAQQFYAAAEIHGLTPEARRQGIKNPMATMAGIESWLPGAIAPSVQTKAILRFAGRDLSASVVGIDPHREGSVSQLPTQMRQGTLSSLYTATNALIVGDRLVEKMGVRIGSNIAVIASEGIQITGQVVGTFHSGVRSIDEGTVYALVKTGQILAGQTGLVNELRVRVGAPLEARTIAGSIERETGYKSVSWQEAHEDLLSSFLIRNLIMYTVVGAILLVASFGTYNIISTITYEKSRDIAIMKSLGLTEATVRWIFVVEAQLIGLTGALLGFALGYLMSLALGHVEIKSPFMDATHLPLAYEPTHYLLAGLVALISSVLAGFAPARKAARLHPVDIIRGAT